MSDLAHALLLIAAFVTTIGILRALGRVSAATDRVKTASTATLLRINAP